MAEPPRAPSVCNCRNRRWMSPRVRAEGPEPRWVLQLACQHPSQGAGTTKGRAGHPRGLGLGCRAAGRASAERGGPRGRVLLPLALLNRDISSRNSTTGPAQPLPGHVCAVWGTRASRGGFGVHPCCWPSAGTQGHQAGSRHGRWRLVRPGRQRCLASRSGLGTLVIDLVTKLTFKLTSPAHVACPLGSVLSSVLGGEHLKSLQRT